MASQTRCNHRVTHLVREVGWWDFYMTCDKHVAWARAQFPAGMRLVEVTYPGKGYQEIASGCVYDKDGDALLKRQKRTRASGAATPAASTPDTTSL